MIRPEEYHSSSDDDDDDDDDERLRPGQRLRYGQAGQVSHK